jgi:hypothetical protein
MDWPPDLVWGGNGVEDRVVTGAPSVRLPIHDSTVERTCAVDCQGSPTHRAGRRSRVGWTGGVLGVDGGDWQSCPQPQSCRRLGLWPVGTGRASVAVPRCRRGSLGHTSRGRVCRRVQMNRGSPSAESRSAAIRSISGATMPADRSASRTTVARSALCSARVLPDQSRETRTRRPPTPRCSRSCVLDWLPVRCDGVIGGANPLVSWVGLSGLEPLTSALSERSRPVQPAYR